MPNDRVRRFHELHRAGCFVMPNPWDVGSARLLAQLGFPALATTSSGFAWSLGRPDNQVTLAEALTHLRAMSESASTSSPSRVASRNTRSESACLSSAIAPMISALDA